MLKRTKLRCTKCGYTFKSTDFDLVITRCLRCTQTFVISHGRHFASISRRKSKRISSLRESLEMSVNDRNFFSIKNYSTQIREMIPHDLIANFYYNLAEKRIGDSDLYSEFLVSLPEGTSEEYEYILEDMLSLEFFDDRDYNCSIIFIDNSNLKKSIKEKARSLLDSMFNSKEVLDISLNERISIPVLYNKEDFSCNMLNGGYFYFYSGSVYSSAFDHNYIFKINISDLECSPVVRDSAVYISIVNDIIYYCNLSNNGHIYRINTNGTRKVELYSHRVQYLQITNNSIYFLENNRIYCIDFLGKSRDRVIETYARSFIILGDFIYYHALKTNLVMRFHIKTGNIIGVSDNPVSKFTVVKNNLIYISFDDKKLYRQTILSDTAISLSDRECFQFCTNGNFIYYISDLEEIGKQSSYGYVYKVSISGGANKQLNSSYTNSLSVVGDMLFYSVPLNDSDEIWYSMDVNGMNQLPLHRSPHKLPLFKN